MLSHVFRPMIIAAPLVSRRRVGDSEAAWAPMKRWTGHLKGAQAVKQGALVRSLPVEDTLLEPFRTPRAGAAAATGGEASGGGGEENGSGGGKYGTCAVVGSSGAMMRARAGRVIDEHDAVFRFNNAPTRRFEDHVGSRVTYYVMNRAASDALLEKQARPRRVDLFHTPRVPLDPFLAPSSLTSRARLVVRVRPFAAGGG